MAELRMRDVTRAGRELGRWEGSDLPSTLTLGALLEHRIEDEVSVYNRAPGGVFVGMVQPPDSIRHSDGFRMRVPRELDATRAIEAAREAVQRGMVAFEIGPHRTVELDHACDLEDLDEVRAVFERPLVAESF